ncbi:unnamed protein product [Caretta caretta]
METVMSTTDSFPQASTCLCWIHFMYLLHIGMPTQEIMNFPTAVSCQSHPVFWEMAQVALEWWAPDLDRHVTKALIAMGLAGGEEKLRECSVGPGTEL